MNVEWQTLTVDQIKAKEDRAVAIGPFGSRMKAKDYVESGVPVIRGNNISETRKLVGEFVYVSEDTADKLRASNVFADDLVFPHRGAIGQVGIVPRSNVTRFMLSTSLMKLTCDQKKVDPLFVFYFFRSSLGRHALLQNASTVGTPGIGQPLASLRSISLPVPPLEEQCAIAHILGTLDDKIELNRRQNETLEAMARALFKAWFVDFEPVRAKMDGRWQRGQSLPGLPAHLYDLFPDRLVESELGLIPEGWEITTLSNYSELNPESWNKRTMPEKIQYIDLSGVKWGRIENVVTYEGKTAPSRARRILKPLDTIVGTVRPGNGSYTLVAEEGLTGSTGFAVLRPLKQEYSEIVYLASTSDQNIKSLADLADGAAYPAVRPAAVLGTAVPKVSDEVSSEFSDFTAPLFSAVAENERKSIDLALLRDTLLPRLISGKLRVADA